MLNSMTGFGRHQEETSLYNLKLEIKSVNSRFLDLHFRMPKYFYAFEEQMRKQISARLKRGKIDIYIDFQLKAQESLQISANYDLMDKYHNLYQEIIKRFALKDTLALRDMILIDQAISVQENEPDEKTFARDLKYGLDQALDKLILMRASEGEALARDLCKNADALKQRVAQIESMHQEILRAYKEHMAKRITDLLEDKSLLSEERLEIELAIYAERKDIAEELTRIRSHLIQLDELLQSDMEVGRTLDFLAQELGREINTIGSKSSGYPITKEVIDMKSLLDKIREQIQNVE